MSTKEKEAERVLKALANARRLTIVKYLNENKQASVGQVAEHIKLSFKSTSNHLLLLSAAGILEREQTSTNVFYSFKAPIPPLVKHVLTIL